MQRKGLLILLLSSFILPLFVISYTFAHEISIPKALSGLTIFYLFLPLFFVHLHKRGWVDLPLFLPFFLLFLTFLFSGFSFKDLTYRVVDSEGYLVYLYIVVIIYLIFLAVYNLRPTAKEKRVFLGVIFGLSVIEALIGLLQYKGLGEVFLYLGTGSTRVSGTFGYSNYLGFFLSLGIVSALFLYLEYEEWFKKGGGIRGLAFLFLVGFIFAVLNITGSRAGIIDASLGLVAFLFLTYRFVGGPYLWERRRYILYFLTILLFATLIVNLSIKETTVVRKFAGTGNITTPNSTGDRAVMWLSAVEMFKDHPLTGVGLGNFSNHFSLYMEKVLNAYPSDFLKGSATFHLHTHNDYLETLSETGLAGFIALGIFGLSLVWRLKRFLDQPGPEQSRRAEDRLYRVALVSLTIPLLFDASVSLPLHYFPFLTLLAMILGQTIPEGGERNIPFRRGAVKITFVVAAVLSIINLITIWDIGRADINLEKGFKTGDITYLHRAMENPLIRSKAMPFYSQLLFWEGETKGDRGLMEQGIGVMKDYYAFQPTTHVAHSLGQYYLSLGDKKEALKWWHQGLKFQPGFKPILFSIKGLSSPQGEKRTSIFETLRKKLNEKRVKDADNLR